MLVEMVTKRYKALQRFFLGPFFPNRSRIHERTNSLRFLSINLRVGTQTCGFRIQCLHFKPLLLNGEGSKIRLVEVAVNSKEENSQDFFPNYVQEFGLRKDSEKDLPHLLRVGKT
jgi:hypothetical protein